MSDSRGTVTFALLLLVCFSGSVISVHELDRLRPRATLEEVLYLPSPTIIKRLSLGFEGLVADIYWTRAVQYFGSKHLANSLNYELLYPLLDITTRLDPQLIPAYEFGSIFLTQPPPAGAGSPHEAVALLDRGIQNNPQEWRLYQDLGFIYYVELKDYPAAGKAFAAAAELPGAHPFLKVMAARTLAHGGDYETSQMLWRALYESAKDPQIKTNALKHLIALRADEEVTELEQAVQLYRQRTGHAPSSFADLIQAGILVRIPVDPKGDPYEMLPDGSIQIHDYLQLPYIHKGLPPGKQPSDFDFSRP